MNEQEEQRGKALLDEYYAKLSYIESLAVADALEEMKKMAENLVDYITDVVYWE